MARALSDSEIGACIEGAVAVAAKNLDCICKEEAGVDVVEAVVVGIAECDGDGQRAGTGADGLLGAEGTVAVTEEELDGVAVEVGGCEVFEAVAVDMEKTKGAATSRWPSLL